MKFSFFIVLILCFFNTQDFTETFFIVADVHGTGGELNLEVPYYGMAEYFLDAAQELGYNRSDLNGRYTEGTK